MPPGGGFFTVFVLLCFLVFDTVVLLLGLSPEQRARRQARRMAREAAIQARRNQREAQRLRQEWYELLRRQQERVNAGFANEAEAIDALRGRGGRRSTLDDRMF